MPRVSSKENKNIYFKQREKLGLTRETASDLLETIAPERIEKIENERCEPHPDEVLVMSEKYNRNYVIIIVPINVQLDDSMFRKLKYRTFLKLYCVW